jgi:hypothetical protein
MRRCPARSGRQIRLSACTSRSETAVSASIGVSCSDQSLAHLSGEVVRPRQEGEGEVDHRGQRSDVRAVEPVRSRFLRQPRQHRLRGRGRLPSRRVHPDREGATAAHHRDLLVEAIRQRDRPQAPPARRTRVLEAIAQRGGRRRIVGPRCPRRPRVPASGWRSLHRLGGDGDSSGRRRRRRPFPPSPRPACRVEEPGFLGHARAPAGQASRTRRRVSPSSVAHKAMASRRLRILRIGFEAEHHGGIGPVGREPFGPFDQATLRPHRVVEPEFERLVMARKPVEVRVPYLASVCLVGLHQREARRRNVGALRPGAERVADEGTGEVAFPGAEIAGQKNVSPGAWHPRAAGRARRSPPGRRTA